MFPSGHKVSYCRFKENGLAFVSFCSCISRCTRSLELAFDCITFYYQLVSTSMGLAIKDNTAK